MPATKKSIALEKELANLLEQQARAEKVQQAAKEKGIKLTDEENTAFVKLGVQIEETAEKFKKFSDGRTKESKAFRKQIQDDGNKIFDSLNNVAKSTSDQMSGVFGQLKTSFGQVINERQKIDEAGGDTSAFDALIAASEEFLGSTEMTADQAESLMQKLKGIDIDSLGPAAKDIADSIQDGAAAMGLQDSIMDALNLKAFSLAATLGSVVEALANAVENAKQLQETLGLSNSAALKLSMNSKSLALSLVGLGDELRGAQGALISSLDSVSAASNQDLINTFMFLETSLGVSSEQAGQLTNTMINLTGASAENAALMVQSAAALAKANDVAPGDVIEDMAANGEMLAKFSNGTAEGMARAAIQAKKMGIELSKVGQVMDGLLDLESSITSEFEASVLLGRELNFDRARQLALNNDIEGAMNEIVDQLGSEEEFNKLNAIQRQALADSIGVGVEDLASMVSRDAAVTEGMDPSLRVQMDILDVLKNSLGVLSGLLSAIATGIAGFGGFKLLSKANKALAGRLSTAFKGIFSKIAAPLAGIVELVTNLSMIFGKGATEDSKAQGTGGLVGAVIGGALGAISGPVGAAIGISIGGMIGRALANTAIGDAFANYFSGAINAVRPVFENLRATFDKIMTIFEGPDSIGTKIGKAIGTLIVSIPGLVIDLAKALIGLAGNMFTFFITELPSALGTVLVDAAVAMKDAVIEAFSAIFDTIGDAIKEVMPNLSDLPLIGGLFSSDTANDFLSRPGQPIQKFSSADTVVGVKDPSKLGGGFDPGIKTELMKSNIHLAAIAANTKATADAISKLQINTSVS